MALFDETIDLVFHHSDASSSDWRRGAAGYDWPRGFGFGRDHVVPRWWRTLRAYLTVVGSPDTGGITCDMGNPEFLQVRGI